MRLDAIEGFDPRASFLGALNLVEIETPDGDFGFIVGTDGIFTSSTGAIYYGSRLLKMSNLQSAIDGIAPAGSVTLSYFQDPAIPDMVAQIKALGVDYVAGREIRFLWQPAAAPADLQAPTIPVQRWATRVMRTLTFAERGVRGREITLSFETWAEDRRTARRIRFDQEGHETLLGAANPSLEFRPTTDRQDEPLF